MLFRSVTMKLLKHFEIRTPVKAFHQHNEHRITAQLVEELSNTEKSYALVSDAGTPGISDPAYLLVKACLDAEVEVECLPGATAFVPALIKSGLPASSFCFEGFLPQKKGRNTRLQGLKTEEHTMIFYESPYRIVKTLQQFCEVFGNSRRASVSRELTKIYEETINGTLNELTAHFQNKEPKGEFVIVVEGKSE